MMPALFFLRTFYALRLLPGQEVSLNYAPSRSNNSTPRGLQSCAGSLTDVALCRTENTACCGKFKSSR